MSVSGLPPAEGLVIRVVANPAAAAPLRSELNRPPRPPDEVQTISVSKLVNPGRAYYDMVMPVDEGIAAHESRLAGAGAHEALEAALAPGPELTEMWLSGEDAPGTPSLEGIIARVDACELLQDGRLSPTELKTVRSLGGAPFDDHLEQLGMYCALTGVDYGHLIRVARDDPSAADEALMPLRVSYRDLGMIREEMVRRRDMLLEAVRTRDPSRLPACPWWLAGCEQRRAGHCSCDKQPRLEPVIARSATTAEDPQFQTTLRTRIETWARSGRRRALPPTLRQSLILRKVYFERRSPPSEAGEGTESPTAKTDSELAKAAQSGLGRELTRRVKLANRGSLTWITPDVPGVRWSIPMVEGRPFLVKVRHVGRAVDPTVKDLTGAWGAPEDIRLLAAHAALAGTSEGRIYLWNAKLSEEATKLQVFDVTFAPEALAAAGSAARALPTTFEEALEAGDPKRLPLCPSWMCPKCDYRETCRPDLG